MKKIYQAFCILLIILSSCSYLIPGKGKLMKEVERQTIPTEILNTHWNLKAYNNKLTDCSLTLSFLEKGRLIFKFKSETYQGDFLYYLIKGSAIEFHTRPMEKFAWTQDNCEMNPSIFALYVRGDKNYKFIDNKLILTTEKSEMVFIKI